MVSHDEISKLWEGAIMENHSLYNLIAKMGKVLSVDTRIELVTVGKDGLCSENRGCCELHMSKRFRDSISVVKIKSLISLV